LLLTENATALTIQNTMVLLSSNIKFTMVFYTSNNFVLLISIMHSKIISSQNSPTNYGKNTSNNILPTIHKPVVSKV